MLRETKAGYNNKADIWSLGCIGFELFTGRKAFSDDFRAFQYSISRKTSKSFVAGLTPFAKFFIQDLLEIKPENRPSTRDLLRTKFKTKHPPELAETRSRKRKALSPDPSPPSIQSELLTATLRWAASNFEQPQMFRALLEAGNVILPMYVPSVMQLEGRIDGVKAEFDNASDAFMALQAALSAGDIYTIDVLLKRVPHTRELEDLVGQYVTLWSGHVNVIEELVERNIKIKEDDCVNSEALYRLASNSSYEIALKISQIMPSQQGETSRRRLVCDLQAKNAGRSRHFSSSRYYVKHQGLSRNPFQSQWEHHSLLH